MSNQHENNSSSTQNSDEVILTATTISDALNSVDSPHETTPRVEYERVRIESSRRDAKKYLSTSISNPNFQHAEGFGLDRLSSSTFGAFVSLNERIKSHIKQMVYWSSYANDQRQRGYCLLEDSPRWSSPSCLIEEGIRFYDEGVPDAAAQEIHETALRDSCVVLRLTDEEKAGIRELIDKTNNSMRPFRDHLEPFERDVVTFENLVAIQPNLHNNATYLPLHLDCPRNDGFGVVIVTVAIRESAEIILVDEGDPLPEDIERVTAATSSSSSTSANAVAPIADEDISSIDISNYYNRRITRSQRLLMDQPKPFTSQTTKTVIEPTKLEPSEDKHNRKRTRGEAVASSSKPASSQRRCWCYPLDPGEMYVLCGHARNKCAHGVLRPERHPRGPFMRESLNFRFGIHTPQQAFDSVDRHWL